MLIIKVKNGKIEPALKVLKNKVKATKQTQKLRERQEYTKPSVLKRQQKIKAKYKQQMRDGLLD